MKVFLLLFLFIQSLEVKADTYNLIDSILRNDTKKVLTILFTTNDYDINEKVDHYSGGWHMWSHTPLTAGAEIGNDNIVKILVLLGADITSQGEKAIDFAMKRNNSITTLIKIGAKPTEYNLNMACYYLSPVNQRKNYIDEIITTGINITDKCLNYIQEGLNSSWQLSMYRKYYSMAQEQGIQIDLQAQLHSLCRMTGPRTDRERNKAVELLMHTLIGDGAESDLECLRSRLYVEGPLSPILLTKNALTQRDKSGNTALFYVRNAEQIHILIGAGAEVDAYNYNSETTLMKFIKDATNPELINRPFSKYDYIKLVEAILQNQPDTKGCVKYLKKLKHSNRENKEIINALIKAIRYYEITGNVLKY
jgi:hypothetical protein